MEKHEVARMIDGSAMMVRRQSSLNEAAMKSSFPLLQILEGTQRLVNKLHEGNLTMADHRSIEKEVLDQCEERLVLVLKALHRQLKRVNKEAAKKAEFEAKEAAHWRREEAEVARRHKAAEEARKKYDEREAAREAQREEVEREARRQKDAEIAAQSQTHKTQEAQKLRTVHESQTRSDDSSSPAAAVGASLQSVQVSSSDGSSEYILSSFYQQAKEAEGEKEPAPTVIFLPSFQQQGPPDIIFQAPREGSAAEPLDATKVSPADESAAGAPAGAAEGTQRIAVAVSSDESAASSSTDGSGPHVEVALSSEVSAPHVAVSSLSDPSAPYVEVALLRDPSAPSVEVASLSDPSAPYVKAAAPSTDVIAAQRPTAEVPRTSATPIPSKSESVRTLSGEGEDAEPRPGPGSSGESGDCMKIKVAVTNTESVATGPVKDGAPKMDVLAPPGSEPTRPVQRAPQVQATSASEESSAAGKPETEGPSADSALSSEPESGDHMKIKVAVTSTESVATGPVKDGAQLKSAERASVESAAGTPRPPDPEGKSPVLVTVVAHPSDQSSTKGVTTKPSAETTSASVLMPAPPTLAEGGSPAVLAALSSDERTQDGALTREKPEEATRPESILARPAAESSVGDPLSTDRISVAKPAEAILSHDLARPSDGGHATVALLADFSTISGSKEAAGSPSTTAAAMQGGESVAHEPVAAKASAVSVPLVDVRSAASPGDSPPPTVASAVVARGSTGDHPPQTEAESGLIIPAVLPSSEFPTVGSREAGESLPQRSASVGALPSSSIASDDSLVQRPVTAEGRLPRSPSGAPIASGAKIPRIETVSIDESLPQKPTGGMRSPILPRSPSGAPVATAVRFPLEPVSQSTRDESHESVPQRAAEAGLSPASSPPPVSQDTVRAPGAAIPVSAADDSQGKKAANTGLPSTSTGAPVETEASLPAVVIISSPEQKVVSGESVPEK